VALQLFGDNIRILKLWPFTHLSLTHRVHYHLRRLHVRFIEMAFSQSQQAFGPQAQSIPTAPIGRQQLEALPPADRAALYQRYLVQGNTVFILQDGTLSRLQAPLLSSVHLTTPLHQGGTLALAAAHVFYVRNEFALSISTIPNFVPWIVGNTYKPSDLITRLAILYGPPTNTGGGNTELRPLLSMPNLRSLRLIFQDYPFKSLGPHFWLRPSIGAIMELTGRLGLDLKLQLQNDSNGFDGKPEDIDADDQAKLEDITKYLQPPTEEDEKMVAECQRIVGLYQGPRSNHVHILEECGWSAKDSNWVIFGLSRRVAVRDWIEEARLDMLASQDVEML
jgi:hypothetical protein